MRVYFNKHNNGTHKYIGNAVVEKLSDDELATRIRIVCRELLERADEPDFADQVAAALGPLLGNKN